MLFRSEGKHASKMAVSHYIMGKHAMNGLTKATAAEYALQGIRCNAICPGPIETELMKEAGYGQLNVLDIDHIVACTCGGEATFEVAPATLAFHHAGDLRLDIDCGDTDGSDTVRGGARLLVVQTNNATFGYTDESEQQFAISRIRAIEHGRSVVHVSTVGVSGFVAPDGTVYFAESSLLYGGGGNKGTTPTGTIDEHVFISRDNGATWIDKVVGQTLPGIACVAAGTGPPSRWWWPWRCAKKLRGPRHIRFKAPAPRSARRSPWRSA